MFAGQNIGDLVEHPTSAILGSSQFRRGRVSIQNSLTYLFIAIQPWTLQWVCCSFSDPEVTLLAE